MIKCDFYSNINSIWPWYVFDIFFKCFYLIRIDFCLWIISDACCSRKGFFSIIGFHINLILWDAGRVEDSICENVPHKLCFSCSFKMMYFNRTNFGVEKIWRNWRNSTDFAKLNPRHIWDIWPFAQLNPRQI